MQVFLIVTVPPGGGLLIPVYGGFPTAQFPVSTSSYETCLTCGAQVPSHWRFCSQCGNRLHCSNCGKHLAKPGNFCPECGKPTK